MVHPIVNDSESGPWTILPAQSVCQYKAIPGCMPLLSDEDTTPKDFGTGSEPMSLLTYSEVLSKFPMVDDSGEDTDLEDDPDPNPSKGDDHEIEKIMEHPGNFAVLFCLFAGWAARAAAASHGPGRKLGGIYYNSKYAP